MTGWDQALRAALAAGIAPEGFWRLSLREWRALTARPDAGAMSRAEMERLREAWPDVG